MKTTFLVLICAVIAFAGPTVAQSPTQLPNPSTTLPRSPLTREQIELLAQLGFGALTIDAYYEICSSTGRTDNHLNGIDKLTKEKWSVTYSEIAKQEEAETGRDFRGEAQKLVRTVTERLGGCDTVEAEKWLALFREKHVTNLRKFHASDGSSAFVRGVERATPEVSRFVSQVGYEISFPRTWRALQREGFDFIIDKIGKGGAATLSIGAARFQGDAEAKVRQEMTSPNPRIVDEMIAALRQRFPDARLVRSGHTKLGNFPALEIVTTYSLDNPGSHTDILGWTIMAPKNGRLYRVQFEGAGNEREDWMKEAEVILSSFIFQ